MNTDIPEYRRLLAPLEQSFNEKWFALSDNSPDTLWHYTNAGGLLGILQYNQLWLSDNNFMNDSSEMRYALKVVSEVISEFIARGYSDITKHYLNLLDFAAKQRVQDDSTYAFVNSVFICCFCKQADSLHLWRAYTNGGQGYSVGFFVDTILSRMKPVKIATKAVSKGKLLESWHSYDPFLCRVIYEPEEQRAIISELLEDFVKIIERDPKPFISADKPYVQGNIANRLYNLIFRCLYIFKDPAFSEEKEWRLVYAKRLSGDSESAVDDIPATVHYRQSGNYFLPYLKVDAGRELIEPVEGQPAEDSVKKLPFEQIYVGPALDVELARASINSYIYRNGYLGSLVSVEASKVTLRAL